MRFCLFYDRILKTMTTLKLKSTGADVNSLQNKLKKLGYSIVVDGHFGPLTQSAVIDFQTRNNLMPDGVVGPITLAQIDKAIASQEIWGVDVSYWNGPVLWENVLASGATFAIMKSSEGEAYKDPRFQTNYSECKRLKIPCGGYHFYRFFSDPVKQADNFLGCAFDYSAKNTLPPVIDIEWQDNNGASNLSISSNKTLHLARIKKWLDKVEASTGRIPMIYTQQSFWNGLLGTPDGFERYPLWVVDYARHEKPLVPGKWKNWTLWQFSASGHINGQAGLFDLNRFSGNQANWKALIKG
jgi:GH25 family lysozyme M1 (1,4-beta-N-acetylmuramidase)